MGFGAKPQGRSQGCQPPIISPFPRGRQARMPESERTERGTMPRKLSVHKGLGDGDIEFNLLIKI